MSFEKKSESESYANLLKTLVVEAGIVARDMRNDAAVSEKDDRSVVTEADLEVSGLIRNRLDTFLKQDNHILIDEETIDQLPSMEETLAKDYQWVLDPIDGTAPYSAGLPFYAVSLGLMQQGKPWLGAVYLPELDELYYTDGKGNVMRQRGARGAAQPRKMVVEKTELFDYTPISYDGYLHAFDMTYKAKTRLTMSSSVVNGCLFLNSTMAGRVDCTFLWDNAAILAMAHLLGMKTICMKTKQEITEFSTDILDGNWLLQNPIITALPENIDWVAERVEYNGRKG